MGISVNMYEQIMNVYELISKSDGFDVNELELSRATTYRYLKELKERYQCDYSRSGDIVKFTAINKQTKPMLGDFEEVTKQSFMRYMTLNTIANNLSISREELMNQIQTQIGTISQRVVDKWCKQLIEETQISQIKNGKTIEYAIVKGNTLKEELKIELAQLLSHYYMYLPNQQNVTKLIYKLGLQTLQTQTNRRIDLMGAMRAVIDAHANKAALIIITEKGTTMRVVPLYLYYHSNKKKWYLRYVRNSCNARVTHHLNLHHFIEYKSQEASNLSQEKILELYEIARGEDNLAFDTVYEKPVAVKVLFERTSYVIEKAYERLQYFGEFNHHDEEFDLFVGIIYGQSDFFKWIRGFGSSAIILEPLNERKKVIDSTKKSLAYYGRS